MKITKTNIGVQTKCVTLSWLLPLLLSFIFIIMIMSFYPFYTVLPLLCASWLLY